MRSYSESRDQTRPTILLQGEELAIGPAGLDAQGPWGIHVSAEAEGRAQVLAQMLEDAARRLAGSKGSPPRLLDESQTFDREPTGNWAPGAPALPNGGRHERPGRPRRATAREPQEIATTATRVPQLPFATPVAAPPAHRYAESASAPLMVASAPSNPDQRRTPVPLLRKPGGSGGGLDRTALGYQSGAGAQSAIVRLGLVPAVSARMTYLSARVVPADFQVSKLEREILNAIGLAGVMTARAVGQLIHVADPVTWMEDLIRKLESYGLDIVEPGEAHGDEPTYRLR
jgi:hypothetical protein